MRTRILLPGFLILILLPLLTVQAQEDDSDFVSLSSPKGGEAVQGLFPVTASVSVKNYEYVELLFRYHGDENGTWFQIFETTEEFSEGTIFQWDTSMITDGEYDLALVVTMGNNDTLRAITEGIRVRNYTPIELNTPGPSATPISVPAVSPMTPSPVSDEISGQIEIPTPTPLPPNDVIITQTDIKDSVMRGAAGVLAAALLFGLYTTMRTTNQK